MRKGSSSPTIVDVAARAGVSRTTVSRVINDQPVDREMAERVREAVEALGYRPSRLARGLRTQRAQVWAFVISDIRNVFFTEVMRGVEEASWARGHTLIVCNTDEQLSREQVYLEMLLDEHVSGVIIAPASTSQTDVGGLRAKGIPVVAIDRTFTHQQTDGVVVDNAGGARVAVTHLLDNGFSRVACITGPVEKSTSRERKAGWEEALRARGLRPSQRLVRHADYKIDGGREAMLDLLAGPKPPDAVFVANNHMTTGVLQAVAQQGLRVPDDLAIVGFDDSPWSAVVKPPLTTVRQPTYEIGRRATDLLLRRLGGYTGPPKRVVLSPQLVVRGSSGR